MKEMTAVCGLPCHECGALIATKNNDEAKRVEVARQWTKIYRSRIKPEDIYCDGCLSEGGYLFGHCKVCEIRKCGREKGIENCAHCPDFACRRLEKFFKMVPEAKSRLEKIRAELP